MLPAKKGCMPGHDQRELCWYTWQLSSLCIGRWLKKYVSIALVVKHKDKMSGHDCLVVPFHLPISVEVELL